MQTCFSSAVAPAPGWLHSCCHVVLWDHPALTWASAWHVTRPAWDRRRRSRRGVSLTRGGATDPRLRLWPVRVRGPGRPGRVLRPCPWPPPADWWSWKATQRGYCWLAADDDLRREIGQLGTASVAKGLVLIAYIRQRMVRSRPMWTVESAHSYASGGSEAAGRQAKLSGNLAISIARALEASSSAGRIRRWRSG